MTHRIETLRCELHHTTVHAALHTSALQARLAHFLKTEALHRIAAHFDRHDPADRVWQIDRLELDLGRLTAEQDTRQWVARLDESLDLALQRASRQRTAPGPASARRHAIDQLLHYLHHGHLPWGLSLPGRQAMADWLAHLAQAHGAQLWAALQAQPGREALLARLAQIAPHHGLHALLAQRDAALAAALHELDTQGLGALHAHGWLGTHQRQRLQQALRVAGLRTLWSARGSALAASHRPLLLAALRQVLAQHLGPAWATQLATLPAADGSLLRELIADSARPATAAPGGAPPDSRPPSPGWEAALQQLHTALAQPGRHRAGISARIATLLRRLGATHPALLRSRLLQWVAERRQRRQWSQGLTPANLGALLAAMSPAQPGPPTHGTPAWADSLRQTALRLQSQAPLAHRPGLTRLQALLMEACLQRLAEGQRLPDSHSAWQALWQRAWNQWLGEAPAPATAPAHTPPAPALAPLAAPATAPTAALDEALCGLARLCQAGRWAWPQRLRLARLLETDAACARWLALFDERRRWQMLSAQFGTAAQRLRQRANRLQQWLGGVLREPTARLREHWRRLCTHLFVRGLSPDAAALRLGYQAAQTAPSPPPTAALARGDPIWVTDAGQVLLAAYAERLFRQLALTEQGRFVSAQAQAQAVQCLQTLCHGPGPVDAAQTTLSRLLCGAAPATLLPEPEPLAPATECLLEQLLQAVIAHWRVLGHTSVAGLRESFLQREGRLHGEATTADAPPRWRLRVQTRGFDVLLDRLPWGFQTLSLPWMQGVLHVDWR